MAQCVKVREERRRGSVAHRRGVTCATTAYEAQRGSADTWTRVTLDALAAC
jgi:hypothetical protein